MLRIVFLLFITIPLLELWVLIEVGSGIGGLSTIALCLLTAALGGFLIRYQGLSTLVDAQKRMAHGEAPLDHGLHGLMIALSGILLFTPGFITDSIGFLLLFPPFRRFMIGRLPTQQIQSPHQARHNSSSGSDIIDVEVITHDKHVP
ncbi:phage T7 F exclusion suppressor FxsA [Mariprofundus micogutta]|uniref:Phage T7 F exclusion suppressor FxsA n=1 Tax=Mariprofundus micogutta TaxID=1921010 RepID=A0A1L8CN79_9PROT|nr:FxsA family protein [Mariprofundus micogutta]GAV20289.1 phage T7 F exclusion suppressor FxsA [Mariprofundus micogutta]